MAQTVAAPTLITVAQAARLLVVSEKTVRRWIDDERIPFLRLPSGGYRIPQDALLASLGGNYALEVDHLEIAGGPLTLLRPGAQTEWAQLNADKQRVRRPSPDKSVEDLLREGVHLSAQSSLLVAGIKRARDDAARSTA